MGQNFLIEPELVEKIVDIANVQPGETIVEVGPGLGMLTRALSAAGATVIAIELDRDLKKFLDRDLGALENVSIVEADALQVDFGDVTEHAPYKVVANLPYSTGTAIVRRFLAADHPPLTITVMLQREVSERMVAEPPNMSLLTLSTQIHSEASLKMSVPPEVFFPPPKVNSAVVHLVLRDSPLATPDEREKVFRLATVAFQRKRKTISNGLAQGLGRTRTEIEEILDQVGIDAMRRPQTLTVGEWLALARVLAP